MSVISDLMDNFRINNNNDDYDEYEDEYDYEEDEPARSSRFSIFNKKDRDEDYMDEPAEPARPTSIFTARNKVTPAARRTMEVSMVKPTAVVDAQEICNHLLEGKAVVLNMEGIHTEVAQRIIDFTSGATYSMNGKLQKISNYIFIATPEAVNLSGDFTDIISGSSLDMSNFNIKL